MKPQQYFAAKFPHGENLVIDVTALNAALDRMGAPAVRAKVTPSLVKQVRENGIEPEHLDRLRQGEPDFSPATLIECRGRTYVIDGNHRASLWIADGSKVIPVRIVMETMWRLFVIDPKSVTHAQR